MPESLPRQALSEISFKHSLSALERELQSEHRGLGGPDLTVPKEPAYHRKPEEHLVSLSS